MNHDDNPSLTSQQLRVDPHKWKPLLLLFPAMMMAVFFGFLLTLSLQAIFRGYGEKFVEAGIFGLFFISSIYVVFSGLSKWWHRPRGETAILQAAAIVAQLDPAAPWHCRPRPQPPPNKVIYAALPLTFLAISLYGAFISNWQLCIALLIMALIFGGLPWHVASEAKRTAQFALTFDPKNRVVHFENFSFVTSFMPQKPQRQEAVPFDDILDCTFVPGQKGGPPSLRIKTTRGPTMLAGEWNDFSQIRALLESIVTLNMADPEAYHARLQTVPKIRVPWYGWLIMLGAFGGIGAFVWFLFTKL